MGHRLDCMGEDSKLRTLQHTCLQDGATDGCGRKRGTSLLTLSVSTVQAMPKIREQLLRASWDFRSDVDGRLHSWSSRAGNRCLRAATWEQTTSKAIYSLHVYIHDLWGAVPFAPNPPELA